MSILNDRRIRVTLILEGRLIPVCYIKAKAAPEAIKVRRGEIKTKADKAMSILKAAMMRDVREHAARVAASQGIYPC